MNKSKLSGIYPISPSYINSDDESDDDDADDVMSADGLDGKFV